MTDETTPYAEDEKASPAELVVIIGMSGAGRSEAIHTFEDVGFFCVDNLPPSLIPQVLELASLPGSRLERIAVACDMRSQALFPALVEALERLRESGQAVRVLFLEAADRVLVNRFKFTRRRHPLAGAGSIMDGVRTERTGLAPIREQADTVIDTSEMTPSELREAIRREFLTVGARDALSVTVESFGFKYGLPIDADIVMDVRFLPNPYYVPRLRHRTGLDAAVRKFVLGREETEDFLGCWLTLLDQLLPGYRVEGKHHLAIALGCTGGQHRSAVLAEETARHLRDSGYDVSVRHRDIRRSKDEA